ncbi:hypothetical protein [Pedobacter frigiditerrae]|uniref:hypothetical protein n=1 Tax=Pedobacter frigiditerrae TaxID=2530452 RepID=UPI00292D23AC|nr:hypothetical protein [Pedobacter frigiditerrae]
MNVISRRYFLKTGFKITSVAVLLNPVKELFGASKQIFPAWEELVDYARWCPNVHNLQPHKIKVVSDTEALLYYDPARLLPIGDPNCIFVTVVMGIFIEYLSIAASNHNAKVEIAQVFYPINLNADGYTKFAKLKLVPANNNEVIDRELILKRKTSRSHYNGLPVDKTVLEKIKIQANELNHNFFYSNDENLIDFIVGLNQETLFEDINSSANRKELDHLFRYSKEEAQDKKDGLWSRCMGFPGILMKSVFRQPERWAEGIKKKVLANYYKASFNGTATIGWFSGNFSDTADWLNAGKMLGRNWLLITKENTYIQPFGSLITNVSAYKKINEKLSLADDDKKIWMVFRIGCSKEPTRSFRLSTEEIIIK